jgi:hypothetical protein
LNYFINWLKRDNSNYYYIKVVKFQEDFYPNFTTLFSTAVPWWCHTCGNRNRDLPCSMRDKFDNLVYYLCMYMFISSHLICLVLANWCSILDFLSINYFELWTLYNDQDLDTGKMSQFSTILCEKHRLYQNSLFCTNAIVADF